VTVTAPPRPPRPSDPFEREELEALVEALIEEARQRARRRRRIYMAVAASVALVGVAVFTVFERTAQSQSASPALSPRSSLPAGAANSKIAFASFPRGGGQLSNGEIFVVNADGSGRRRLTSNPVDDDFPVWSPDGRKVAFVRGFLNRPDPSFDVYVMNADGSGERRLTRNAAWPAWSPDGRKIAFLRGFPADLYVMNADGSGERRLARNAGISHPFGAVAWSPDGRKIAFLGGGISVMNADGSRRRKLTSNPGDTFPSWSPDGRKIAFVRSDGWSGRCLPCPANARLYVMNSDGSGLRRLTYGEQIDAPPAWSPDGRKIAFERSHRPNPRTPSLRFLYVTELYVMNADGSGQRKLAYGAQPLWSPDGQMIAFVSRRRDGKAELYVMSADGSEQWNLTRTRGRHESSFVWSPGQSK